jgi:hypothetical protein
MKNIFFLLAVAGMIHLASCSTSGKTSKDEGSTVIKQKHFDKEQIEADALAMADISCQWEVAKYNASLQQNNRKLKEKEASLYELKFKLEQKMKIRYLQIEDLKKKYNKALEKAHKQLSACERMDIIRAMEAEKAKGENQ